MKSGCIHFIPIYSLLFFFEEGGEGGVKDEQCSVFIHDIHRIKDLDCLVHKAKLKRCVCASSLLFQGDTLLSGSSVILVWNQYRMCHLIRFVPVLKFS